MNGHDALISFKQKKNKGSDQFSSDQSLSRFSLPETPWTAVHQASLSITKSWSVFKLMSSESVMHSTTSSSVVPSPPTFNISQHQSLFKWVNSSHPVTRVLVFGFSSSPSNEYSALNSFRVDWLDLLTVQRILKSLLQHHSGKQSILSCSDFFIVQLSHAYMTSGKTMALTSWTIFGKVMSLLFNMLFKLVIALFPRNKCLLISWLQSPSAMIFGAPKR